MLEIHLKYQVVSLCLIVMMGCTSALVDSHITEKDEGQEAILWQEQGLKKRCLDVWNVFKRRSDHDAGRLNRWGDGCW